MAAFRGDVGGLNLRLKVNGLDRVLAKLTDLEQALIPERLEEAALAGAEPIRDEMKREAPIGPTGDLAEGIVITRRGKGRGWAAAGIGPSKDEFYGMFVELGTVHIASNPFMRRAADSQADEARREATRSLRRSVRRHVGAF